MSHRSPRKQIEGSNYKNKCSQQAGDVGGMSNCEKTKDKSEKQTIGAKHNSRGFEEGVS